MSAVSRIARFRVQPDRVAEARRVIEAFVAAIDRDEPGTSTYQSYRVHGTTEFVHLMRFRDEAARDTHRATPHVQAFVAALYPLCEERPVFVDLDPVAATRR